MRTVSTTVTMGYGSERHNHDVRYREALDHTNTADMPGSVVELVPYEQTYNAQINALMKPHIDAYNEKQEERYKASWARYERHEIKNRPKARDFAKAGYDYAETHTGEERKNPKTGKMEPCPLWRSIIIGLGDQNDRQTGKITEDEARRVLTKVVDSFRKDFPALHVLGATMHLDEKGFYHAHLDYFVAYEKTKTPKQQRGLQVGHGLDAALESMGYKPEQSIINGRDKAPILFNAMRNRIYLAAEKALRAERIGLEYGVTAKKEPTKDSSRNQSLEAWQETQDAVRTMQHQKNIGLDILERDDITPDELKTALGALTKMEEIQRKIDESPVTLTRKGRTVSFRLLDQMKTLWNDVVQNTATMMSRIKTLEAQLKVKAEALVKSRRETQAARADADMMARSATQLKKELDAKEAELEKLRPKPLTGLDALINAATLTPEQRRINELEREVAALQREIRARDEHMAGIQYNDGTTVLDGFHDAQDAARAARDDEAR